MIWNTSEPIRPPDLPYAPEEITEFIIISRISLYNRSLPCGAKAILQLLKEYDIVPLPSLYRIGVVLKEYGLTHRRTGIY